MGGVNVLLHTSQLTSHAGLNIFQISNQHGNTHYTGHSADTTNINDFGYVVMSSKPDSRTWGLCIVY